MNPTLLAQLRNIQSTIPSLNCRVVPSSFDPTDEELLALPRPLHFHWASCKRILEEAGSRAVANRMPIFWQMQSALHDVCRTLGIPIFQSDPANIPLGAVSIALADIDTIVSETRDISAMSEYIEEKDLPQPRVWIAIHRAGDVWHIPEIVASSVPVVAQEVHLLPSIPVLFQCIALARAKSSSFHLSDAFEWTIGDSETNISCADPFLPLSQFVLPFLLKQCGTCACGSPLYNRV